VTRANRLPAYPFLVCAIAIVGLTLLVHWLVNVPQVEAVLFVMAGFVLVTAAVAPFVSNSLQEMHERRRSQLDAETEAITEASRHIGNPALRKMVLFNYDLMERFIDVALGQAKAAYVFCAAACSAGLLILLTGTVALATADGTTKQLTLGGLTATGTALAGFIGHTFIRTFKITSRQMSYYYGQPVVHCCLLHAEWLAERAAHHDSEIARALDHKLIDATVKAGLNAQRHLLDLIEEVPPASSAEVGSVTAAR
jgi:hypothetical protein